MWISRWETEESAAGSIIVPVIWLDRINPKFPSLSGSLVEDVGRRVLVDCVGEVDACVGDGVGGGKEHPSRLPASPLDVAPESQGREKSLCPREEKISDLSAASSTISTSKHVE